MRVTVLVITSCFKMSGTQTTPQTATNPIIINLPPIDPNYEKEKIQKSFPKKTMMVLSILQIICGCLAVIFQVWLQFIHYYMSFFTNLFF